MHDGSTHAHEPPTLGDAFRRFYQTNDPHDAAASAAARSPPRPAAHPAIDRASAALRAHNSNAHVASTSAAMIDEPAALVPDELKSARTTEHPALIVRVPSRSCAEPLRRSALHSLMQSLQSQSASASDPLRAVSATRDWSPFGSCVRWSAPPLHWLICAELRAARIQAQDLAAAADACDDELMIGEARLLIEAILGRCELLYRLGQLMLRSAAAAAALAAASDDPSASASACCFEIDLAPFVRVLFERHSDPALTLNPFHRAPACGLSALHLLIIGAPPLPDVTAPLLISEAADLLNSGQLYRQHYRFQIEPLIDLLLIHAGPDRESRVAFVNATDDAGNSALHWAANLGRADLVELLIQVGADTELENVHGLTPFQCAEWDRDTRPTTHQPILPRSSAEIEASAESEECSTAAASTELTCPRCSRVYVLAFRFHAHVAICDGVYRPRGRKLSIAATAALSPHESGASGGASLSGSRKRKDDEADSISAKRQRLSLSSTAAPHSSSVGSPPLIRITAAAAAEGCALHSSALRVANAMGAQYGLLLHANQYAEESGRAACKRLLFQCALLTATERGDDGDLEGVAALVQSLLSAQRAGSRLFPLCYRLCASSSLLVAVSYERSRDNAILKQLLKLPHLFYVQCGKLYRRTLDSGFRSASAGSTSARPQSAHPQPADPRSACPPRRRYEWIVSLSPTVLHCAAFAENTAGVALLVGSGAVSADLADAFDGRPLIADLSRMSAGEARSSIVHTLLTAGADLAWLDPLTAEARSVFNPRDAANDEGLSAELIRCIEKERAERGKLGPNERDR